MTEGQWAEQQAAQEGGFFEEGVHGETLTAMYCFDCLIGEPQVLSMLSLCCLTTALRSSFK